MKKKLKDNLQNLLQLKNATETTADLYFYGDIVSSWWGAWEDSDQYPESVKNFLEEAKGKDLNIYINSGGGSVFAGIAIYNMLKRHDGQKTVYVDGLAGSIASVIALAGDKVIIPPSASMMVHKPWTYTSGNATELRKLADDMDAIEECIMNVYQENLKEGVDIETVRELVNAETWLNGKEAAEYFDVEVGIDKEIVACASELFKNYKHVPSQFAEKPTAVVENKVDQEIEEKLNQISLKSGLNARSFFNTKN